MLLSPTSNLQYPKTRATSTGSVRFRLRIIRGRNWILWRGLLKEHGTTYFIVGAQKHSGCNYGPLRTCFLPSRLALLSLGSSVARSIKRAR